MPNVADELAELRRSSVTRKNANKLKDAAGLSTPELEQAALQAKAEREKASNYKKDAAATLNAGTTVVDLDTDFKLGQGAKKRQDKDKKKEAAENLHEFKDTTQKAKIDKVDEVASGSAVPISGGQPEVIIETDNGNDDDDIPQLEQAANADTGGSALPEQKQNRAEKKSRKVMQRLGMRQISGIVRVTLKTGGNKGFFAINNPDVFEKSGTYVVFGEAKQGSSMEQQMQQAQAAKNFVKPIQQGVEVTNGMLPEMTDTAENNSNEGIGDNEDVVLDEAGVEAKDVDLVMSQGSCSRAMAVAALKENAGDLVNAIMSLTI